MTRAFGEILEGNENAVYLGEDVEHGGYYLVTDGLREKFKSRVMDFPPDETSLLGAAMGFFHAGLLPICEIPYSAYLSCGFDMYKEAAAMTWLSGGRQPNGMILRIQGFGKGVFGGNFHTHNEIFLAPGLDVVCFSNGSDYVRGMRYAARQAAVGRMVVSIDSTALLNERHVLPGDDGWLRPFPGDGEEIDFDFAFHVHRRGASSSSSSSSSSPRIAVVTYGNGVLTALRASRSGRGEEFDVIDSPYLSAPSAGLRRILQEESYDGVVFLDVCKNAAVLSVHAMHLHRDGVLPPNFQVVGSADTYNPLGAANDIPFCGEEDLLQAVSAVANPSSSPSP
eukprot:g1366.t1